MKNYVVKTDNNKGATHALGTLIIVLLLAIPTIGLFYSYNFEESEEAVDVASSSTPQHTATSNINEEKIKKEKQERLRFEESLAKVRGLFGDNLEYSIPGMYTYKNFDNRPFKTFMYTNKDNLFEAQSVLCNFRKDTIGPELWKKIVIETLPKNWCNKIKIAQKDTLVKDEVVGQIWARCFGREDANPSLVEFYKASYKYSVKENVGCFFHESAHGNDWTTKANLSLRQRLNFLLKVAERINAKDRFRSDYLSMLNYPNDIPLQNLRRTQEYWAEICEAYFSGQLDKLNQKDIDLIESIVLKDDPTYDPISSYWKRREIIGGPKLPYKTKEEYYAKTNKK